MLHKLSVLTVGVALLLLAANVRGVAQTAAESPANREIDAAFVASHNLDHDQALGHARQAVRLDPDNSRTHRALASVIWLDLLYWRGGMTVD